MNKRQQKAEIKRKLRAHRGAMGTIRKIHFENSGTLAAWRGRSSVQTDQRKQASKQACRHQVKEEGETKCTIQ